MSSEEAVIGLDSPPPRITIPYSVSMPHTLWMATGRRYPDPTQNRYREPGCDECTVSQRRGSAQDGAMPVADLEPSLEIRASDALRDHLRPDVDLRHSAADRRLLDERGPIQRYGMT